MPAGLADGLGLESGLEPTDSFAPAATLDSKAAVGSPLPGVNRGFGCDNRGMVADFRRRSKASRDERAGRKQIGYSVRFALAHSVVAVPRLESAPWATGKNMSSQSSDSTCISTTHLVKSEDLNHHQTLYAGRCVEWCVQMAYIAAENCFDEARPVVFMSIRSLSMRTPARLGEILRFEGRVDYIGESTIGIKVDAWKLQPKDDPKPVATGTFLFCTVDEQGRAVAHGLPALAGASPASQRRWKQDDLAVGRSPA